MWDVEGGRERAGGGGGGGAGGGGGGGGGSLRNQAEADFVADLYVGECGARGKHNRMRRYPNGEQGTELAHERAGRGLWHRAVAAAWAPGCNSAWLQQRLAATAGSGLPASATGSVESQPWPLFRPSLGPHPTNTHPLTNTPPPYRPAAALSALAAACGGADALPRTAGGAAGGAEARAGGAGQRRRPGRWRRRRWLSGAGGGGGVGSVRHHDR